MPISTAAVYNGTLDGGPVETILEQMLDVSIHPPQPGHRFREPARFVRVVFVKVEDPDAVARHEWVLVLVRFVRVGLETGVALRGRFQHLVERVVDYAAQLFVAVDDEGGGAVGNETGLEFFETAEGYEVADDAAGAI